MQHANWTFFVGMKMSSGQVKSLNLYKFLFAQIYKTTKINWNHLKTSFRFLMNRNKF